MSDWSQVDIEGMRAALDAAVGAAGCDEIPVGAALFVDGRCVATACNQSVTNSDPTAHAEVCVLRTAGELAANYRLPDATLYVTLEPCVMCVGAIVQARIKRVVFGAYDKKAGALGSVEDLGDSRALNHRFEINGGLLAEESANLLQDFFAARR